MAIATATDMVATDMVMATVVTMDIATDIMMKNMKTAENVENN